MLGFATFVNNGKVVIAGGTDSELSITALVRYANINLDGTIGRWFELPNLPQSLQRPGFTISNGFYVVAGGFSLPTTTLNSVYVSPAGADGLPGQWTQASNSLPVSECCSVLLTNNNYLYLVGGYSSSSGYLNGVFKSSFEFQAPSPTPTPVPTPTPTPTTPDPSDWPMFKKIPVHTGFNQIETSLTPPLYLRWKFSTNGAIYTSPAVAGNTVYFGSDDGYVYSADLITGTLNWKFNAGVKGGMGFAVANGMVYTNNNKNTYSPTTIYALNANTGTVVWSRTRTREFGSPTVEGGVVYIGSGDFNIYALDAFTGDLLWKTKFNNGITGTPAVYGDKIFVGSWDGNLYALNKDTGVEAWRHSAGGLVLNAPAVADNTVYFSGSTSLIAADTGTGVDKWIFQSLDGGFSGSPTIANSIVYSQTDSGRVYAVDANTGAFLWDFKTNGPQTLEVSSAGVANGIIYIGSTDKNVYALNALTGNVLWQFQTGGEIRLSSPAIKDGMILIGSTDGNLYAFGQTPPVSQLTVIKHVINDNGGTNFANDFTVNVSGNNVSTSSFPGSEQGTTVTLSSSSYNVTESGPIGYSSTFSTDCSGTIGVGETKICTITNDDILQLSNLSPADVWVGLTNSDDVGIRFDLRAEVYKNGNLVGSGSLDSVPGGSSGFNNAKLDSIPLALTTPVAFNPGDTLSITVLVRNACSGSGKNSGRARLWYNDSVANTHFDATIAGATNNYYFLTGFGLSTSSGSGPKATIDVQAGSKCSPYQSFGTWNITP